MITLPATVRTWHPTDGGTAFLDDGTVVDLPAKCLQDSGFRLLRPGQRVRLHLESEVVVRLTLP